MSFVKLVRYRAFSTAAGGFKATPPPPPRSKPLIAALGLTAAAAGWFTYQQIDVNRSHDKVVPAPGGPVLNKPPAANAKPLDYKKVYNRIVSMLEKDTDYEDGSYGPVLLRLAWHASGTYDVTTNTGGSNKATMRFPAESNHGGNAGLKVAREKLEPIKQEFPEISYGDLWTLAGVAAIQTMGGPTIPWRGGRTDGFEHDCTPDGRLPDGSKDAKHLRKDIFYRMGFNDQEIVALSGAHAVGRCHTDRSGFTGPWTPSPTLFTNDYFVRLFDEEWVEKKWSGPKQYTDAKTGELMMLPTDMVLKTDNKFRKYAETYARDDKKFREDFSAVCAKLFELGVPFKGTEPVYKFSSE